MLVSHCSSSTSEGETHQDDLRLIQLLLHLHDRICLPRILVLLQVGVDLGEGDGGRSAVRRLGNLGDEIVE